MTTTLRTLLTAALIASATACSQPAERENPVATPTFTPNRSRAALNSPLDITYKFVVAQDAPKFEEDYRVFVHFQDLNDELMWTDDHDPPVPTTKWTPGQVIEYTRTTFVPRYPYLGEANVRLGLYSQKTGRRLPLAGSTDGQRAYNVGKLELLPQSENVFLIFKDGWHAAEVSRDNAAIEWQWTRKDATIAFANPKRDSDLILQLDGRPDFFPIPQQVTVSIGDQVLDTFAVDKAQAILRKVPMTAAQLGTADNVEVKLSVDKTVVPAQTPEARSKDPRELGIRVFHAFVQTR